MITVDEIMTRKVLTLKESDSVHDARELMQNECIRHIPIVNDAGKLTGIFTQRDLLAASNPLYTLNPEVRDQEESAVKLGEVMSKTVSTTHPNASLRDVAIFLQSKKLGCLPVVEHGELCGIITDSDFVEVAINLIEQVELSESSVEDEDLY